MPWIATPARRRLAMAAMLGLAAAGTAMRQVADDPSTLRDVGSLLMVMWLPAVGNLVGFFMRLIPHTPPPPTRFAPGSAFAPQLLVGLRAVAVPQGFTAALDASDAHATAIVGRQGFTVRLPVPVVAWLDGRTDEAGDIALEVLRPDPALKTLQPNTAFHLLVGTTVVAQGTVLQADGQRLGQSQPA